MSIINATGPELASQLIFPLKDKPMPFETFNQFSDDAEEYNADAYEEYGFSLLGLDDPVVEASDLDISGAAASGRPSRDFVAWMKTIPKSRKYQGSGLKQLIANINPTLSQEQTNEFIVDITEAAKAFPTFCNTGNERKDI